MPANPNPTLPAVPTPARTTQRPLIVLEQEFVMAEDRLGVALDAEGYSTLVLSSRPDACNPLDRLPHKADLLVLALEPTEKMLTEQLRDYRRLAATRQAPILGITRFDRLDVDIPELRSFGIIGLADERADCATAVRRVEQLFGAARSGRGAERAHCFLPVMLSPGAREHQEFALDLSVTGMRLTVSHPIEPNTDLRIRFKLPTQCEEMLEVRGRVIHRSRSPNSAGRWEVGLFFYELDEQTQGFVSREVTRLLG